MASLRLRHVLFTVVLFSIGISSCRGQGGGAGGAAIVPGTQDAIQIVAQAALCFDNRPVINGCLQSMGINVTSATSGGNTSASAPAPAPAPAASANGSTATMCSAPCFGQMTMMMGCVNGILSNIVGYSPGLMQGVQAIFQMSCGNVNGQGGGAGGGSSAGTSGGGGGGSGGGGGGGGAGSTNNVSPNSGKAALEMFEKACHCFDDHNVYSECKEELRLGVEGAFHVGKESVDEYCGGPCLMETKMALQCVEEVADEGFRFYSGASVPAVKAALDTGCSYTPERGTFEIRERKQCGDEYYHYSHHEQEQQQQPGSYDGDYGHHEQEQQQPAGYGHGYGQEGEYPTSVPASDYCYGAGAGSPGLRYSPFHMLMLFSVVSAVLLLLVI
ncbi:hypothetical protein E2562_018455 [Oryza meyeriana var. granulata]|uniref:DUF7731 domain-containing protein n=1 Tax=Oryza meyeriana var. granulata TaxID=110450 RepID=A0A6G1EME8_9ORYZ|nr:hypothetical protein E2562_018455 [Oryza meyeriana var. granulata]